MFFLARDFGLTQANVLAMEKKHVLLDEPPFDSSIVELIEMPPKNGGGSYDGWDRMLGSD